MNPDAIINVRFRTTDEGGRSGPVLGDSYSCPLFVDGEGFDCRILLGSQRIELGQWYKLPVKFLRPDMAIPMLLIGKPITLWEMKDVADGEILELVSNL
jgi:hypothetical protein